MKKTLGAVFAGAVLTLATAPAAMAQTDTPTSPTETTTTTSESSASTSDAPASSSSVTTTSSPTPIQAPLHTNPALRATDGVDPAGDDVTTTTTTSATSTPEPPYQDNIGHGFVGLGGEGILVIQCASGPPGDVSTANLTVTGGPDQDESDGRVWNYSVRVVTPPATPTAPFSWTCNGQEGHGVVEFEQEQPPTTTTSSSPTSSTAPITTAPATSTASNPGGSAPQAQVKVSPKGGVETGFGGTAR